MARRRGGRRAPIFAASAGRDLTLARLADSECFVVAAVGWTTDSSRSRISDPWLHGHAIQRRGSLLGGRTVRPMRRATEMGGEAAQPTDRRPWTGLLGLQEQSSPGRRLGDLVAGRTAADLIAKVSFG